MPRPIHWCVAAALLPAALIFVGCLPMQGQPDQPFTGTITRAMQIGQAKLAAKSSNRFALDFYAAVRQKSGNLFFSPYSVSAALAMTSAGARGETLDEMARVLHQPSQQDLHPAMGALAAAISRKATHKVELSTANALWGQKGRSLQPDFLSLTRRHYGTGLQEVDFIGNAESARNTINSWTARQTRDRIQNLIGQGILDRYTRLVLTNAVYFKAKWASAFERSATQEQGDFHLVDGRKTKTPLMRQTARFHYAEADGLQILEMPYIGKEFSLVVVLPNRDRPLPGVEARLRAELDNWLANLREEEVIVHLPRFRLTAEMALAETLMAMGMKKVFSESEADLTGLSSHSERLFLRHVLHKAFVEVSEEGTEAAAATAAVVASLSAATPRKPQPPEFIADRPFVYLICEKETGAILFMGRMTHP